MTSRLLLLVTAVALLLPACNGGQVQDAAQEPTPSPGSTPTSEPEQTPGSDDDGDDIQWATCEHPSGITVDYPEDWHVNEGSTLPACSAFDREPLDVPEAQEFFGAAVLLSVEPVDFATAADPESQTGQILDQREQMVDGHDAVRIEKESQGDALLPDGTRTTRWLIVVGREETLSMVTHETDDSETYESNQRILDLMVPRLQLPDNG